MEENFPRKLIHDEESDIVTDALTGSILCNPDLGLLDFGNVIIRRDYQNQECVNIISGMGSGHEPTPIGFVGDGMLTASIQGKIFNSPPVRDILRTIKEVTFRSEQGVLVIIGNNNGECLNFGLAVERAKNDGVKIKILIVGDDCQKTGRFQERRGLGGLVLVYKVAGAMAKSGSGLGEMYHFCEKLLPDMTSISVCLQPSSSPSAQTCVCTKYTSEHEIQIGVGLHGEPGLKKIKPTKLEDVCKALLDEMMNPNLPNCFELEPNVPLVLLVNNLGSTAKMEELLFVEKFAKLLREKEVELSRIYCGRYMTALDMSGFSVTLLKVRDPALLTYLDAPCQAPAWNMSVSPNFNPQNGERIVSRVVNHRIRRKPALRGPALSPFASNVVFLVVQFACNALISCENQLNKIDAELGDGDTGSKLRNGCEALLAELESGRLKTTHPFTFFEYISKILEVTIAGATGFIYGIMFEAAAYPFESIPEEYTVTEHLWLAALESATAAVQRYTNADEHTRSLYVPMNVCTMTTRTMLKEGGRAVSALGKGVSDAEMAAVRTRRVLNNHPDAGAHAVGIWLRAVYEGVKLRYEDDD